MALTSDADAVKSRNLVPGANVILCADDYAMTAGVTRGIGELARARRLSATSAIVTLSRWQADAATLRDLRGFIATGLHLNLTLGAPITSMPRLAPDGELPDNVHLVRQAIAHSIDLTEVKQEISRQIDRFVEGTGFAPDFIDGHQHVHALPGIRTALLDVVSQRFPRTKPLIRDPSDTWTAIAKRKTSILKAAGVGLLASGFGKRARSLGFPVNHGFAGFSPFKTKTSYLSELDGFFAMRGPRHLVMCHPGYVDEALAELDTVVERRRQEFDALFSAPRLESAIWHVRRNPGGPPVDWREALPV